MWATLHCRLRVREAAPVYLDNEDVMTSKCSTRKANSKAIKCLSLMKVLVVTQCALGSQRGRAYPLSGQLLKGQKA